MKFKAPETALELRAMLHVLVSEGAFDSTILLDEPGATVADFNYARARWSLFPLPLSRDELHALVNEFVDAAEKVHAGEAEFTPSQKMIGAMFTWELNRLERLSGPVV